MSFKPYYNWNTFNTKIVMYYLKHMKLCFKPYYNWNTFNTPQVYSPSSKEGFVLNLIITGIPSILSHTDLDGVTSAVLNLIITGIPSIQKIVMGWSDGLELSFKPYYNWNTFNTRC